MSIQPVVEVLVVVTTEQIDRHTVADFIAELAEGLRCCAAMSDPSPDLVVDFRQVTFLDSTGVRELIDAEQAISRRGGRLVVCGAHGDVLRCLEVTGALERFGGASTNGTGQRPGDEP